MLLQTNSYIVPKERRAEHARLIRRFRQALARIGCDQFEVYEQVGANWSPGGANGRYVQIMRFRDRQHQQAVQAAEREDHGAQHIIAEFCELINFPYQQQHGYFATGFYTSVLPVGPRQAIEASPEHEMPGQHFAPPATAGAHEAEEAAEWEESAAHEHPHAGPEHAHEDIADDGVSEEELAAELPEADAAEEAALSEEPAEQVAAEAAVANAFLDTVAEEELPTEEMAGVEPSAPAPSETAEIASEETAFAEEPVAPALIEEAATEELVTAETFVPHMPSAGPEVAITEAAAGHAPLDEAELAEFAPEDFEPAEPGLGELITPDLPSEHPMGESDAGLAFPAAESASDEFADLHQEVLGDMGLEFGEPETAAHASAEPPISEAEELGLDFKHVEPARAEPIEASTGELDELGLELEHAETVKAESTDAPADELGEFGLNFDRVETPNAESTETPLGEPGELGLEFEHAESAKAESAETHVPEMGEAGFEFGHSEPAKAESVEDHASELGEQGLDFEHAELTTAELPEHPVAELGGHGPEVEHADTANAESAALHTAELNEPAMGASAAEPMEEAQSAGQASAGHAHDMGLDFDDMELPDVSSVVPSMEMPAESGSDVTASPAAESPVDAEQPFIEEIAPLEMDAAPAGEHPMTPETPVVETSAEHFELDEGLIFDDEDMPAEDALPDVATIVPEHPRAASQADHFAGNPTHHATSPLDAAQEEGLEPLLPLDPEDAEFGSLLDDTNLMNHAPASMGNGSTIPASHAGRETSGVDTTNAAEEKDADLLEFDAFLRQLDEEHGRRSN